LRTCLRPVLLFAQISEFAWWMIVAGWIVAALLLAYLFRYFVFITVPIWIISRFVYRIRCHGLENVPATGPALLVCNHISQIDAGVIVSQIRRPIRFLIYTGWMSSFPLKYCLRIARAIPVNSNAGPRSIVQSLRTASEALAKGELVCIFAEGAFPVPVFCCPSSVAWNRSSNAIPAPIIPVCLDHAWGSIFSFRGGRFIWKIPRHFPYPIYLNFGSRYRAAPPPGRSTRPSSCSLPNLVCGAPQRVPVHRQFVRMHAPSVPLLLCRSQ